MSRWQSESSNFGHYADSRTLNTVVGFTLISLLMGLGTIPHVANFGDYLNSHQ